MKIVNRLLISQKSCIYHKMFEWVLNEKLYGPFLWMRFNCFKATEALRGDSLLIATQFPGLFGTNLIHLRRREGWVDIEPLNGFEPETVGLGIQCLS